MLSFNIANQTVRGLAKRSALARPRNNLLAGGACSAGHLSGNIGKQIANFFAQQGGPSYDCYRNKSRNQRIFNSRSTIFPLDKAADAFHHVNQLGLHVSFSARAVAQTGYIYSCICYGCFSERCSTQLLLYIFGSRPCLVAPLLWLRAFLAPARSAAGVPPFVCMCLVHKEQEQ